MSSEQWAMSSEQWAMSNDAVAITAITEVARDHLKGK